jgi:2-hydroxy-3-keto-5-methylthiopentenyl-1-phosphate phosphatase
MDNVNQTFNAAMDKLKEDVKNEVSNAYKQGAKDGTILTCATIYRVLEMTNLSKDNILFNILKDLAARQGCEDLASKAKELEVKNEKNKA